MSEELTCGQCGSADVWTKEVIENFQYGVGTDGVRLVAKVPLRRCGACGFEFTDDAAEDRREEAVRSYRAGVEHKER